MSDIKITHPASDGNGTSIIIDGTEMNTHILADGVTLQSRKHGQPPLLTLTLPPSSIVLTGDFDVAVDDRTAELLAAAGWTRAEVSA